MPAFWAPILATYILGAIGGASVIPALIRTIEQAEAQDCDWVTGEISSIMGRLGAPARPPLTALLNDRSRSTYLRSTAAEALAATPEIEQIEPGIFDWYEVTPKIRRTLGTIRLTDEHLTLETASEARAERGRQMLENLAPQALRYRVTSTEELKQTLERAESRHRADPPRPLPPDVEAELLHKYYDEHYRAWVDQPVPALDNQTPRQAARDPRWRPKLIALLKEFENRGAHDAKEGRPWYDFTWMWKELGLERP